MSSSTSALPWLQQLNHDLVKRLLWRARDCRALGIAAAPGELLPSCIDEAGEPIEPWALWLLLRRQAPVALDLTAFEAALQVSLDAARRDDIDGVLDLERAFGELRAQGTR